MMKNLLLLSISSLHAVLYLIGCVHVSKGSDQEKSITISKRTFIILDSINDSLPPEAKKIKSMPSSLTPQKLPNANWKDPIVITKMPFGKK
ncbi:MAG: hypothetical protein ACO1OT_07025 [Heyndrickxia sp.]